MTNIRLVTYNIRLGIQEGLASIADVLAAEDADVIALQEVGSYWTMGPNGDSTAELAELLGMRHWMHAPAIIEGQARYGHALLSRWPFASCEIHGLQQVVDEPRTAMRTLLYTPEDTLVEVISTHLSHVGDRPAQGAELLDIVRRSRHPTVVMGDLNAVDDEAFMTELLSFTEDADPAARRTFPAHAPDRRIDYILARDGALKHVVVGTNNTASDHLYIAATWTVSPLT